MKVVFLHPDLGIGGAERLVLDAALALKKKEHDVHIVTNQFSEDHCFEEAKEFKESGKLEVVAKNVPRTIFGKCYALCAYIRLCIAAAYIYWYHSDADVIFCDQISAPLPIFRMLPTKGTKASLLFYCHYPDQLLTSRNTFWKTVYRLAIDYIESCTMNCADRILVNSHFTERVVLKTFPALSDHSLTVLHPSINCEFFDQTSERLAEQNGNGTTVILEELGTELFDLIEHDDNTIFLSINRFERKKNIELAIHAFEHLIHKTFAPEDADRCFLVIAGGYDPLNAENIDYYEELQAKSVGLGGKQIRFVKSPSDETKIWLMEMANLVVYTPDREHFGIVPIEAMYLSTPVLAVNSGGPLETVEHEKTGFLRPADPQVFAQAMAVAVDEPDLLQDMGVAGRQRVEDHFSFDAFADKLDNIVRDMRKGSDRGGEDQQQHNEATEEE